jgi:hypothetical protein
MSPSPDRDDGLAPRALSARDLTIADRRNVLAAFFERWPGRDQRPPGLGLALVEFQEWEIESGRLADRAGRAERVGSDWWAVVNGWLVLDLAAALEAPLPDTTTPADDDPWIAYQHASPEHEQAALWAAHQHSIETGAHAAAPALADEAIEEQEFAELALGIVDAAAAMAYPTSDSSLGHQTRTLYPSRYPCPPEDLDAVRRSFEAMASHPPGSPGPR